jgi:hypothetical protein
VAQKAVEEGYNIIKYNSVEVPGTVNYAIFDNFDEILSPEQVIEVSWDPQK